MPPNPHNAMRIAPAGDNPPPAASSRLRALENGFCAALMVLLITGGLLAVLRRFAAKLPVLGKLVLSGSLSWPEPLAQHLVLWVALFGAGAAAADRSHIAIDALAYVLPGRVKRYVTGFTNLLTALVCAVFAWLAIGFVRTEFRDNPTDITFFGLHSCWLTLVLPVGFALLAGRGLWQLIADLRALGQPPSPAPISAAPPPAGAGTEGLPPA